VGDLRDFGDGGGERGKVDQRLGMRGQQRRVKTMLAKTGAETALPPSKLPPAVTNLQPYFSPIEDQGPLGSCTANAAVGLVEYFERRAFGRHIDASRLFLYKPTRNLLHLTGDTGAYLPPTLHPLLLFALPPHDTCPSST